MKMDSALFREEQSFSPKLEISAGCSLECLGILSWLSNRKIKESRGSRGKKLGRFGKVSASWLSSTVVLWSQIRAKSSLVPKKGEL